MSIHRTFSILCALAVSVLVACTSGDSNATGAKLAAQDNEKAAPIESIGSFESRVDRIRQRLAKLESDGGYIDVIVRFRSRGALDPSRPDPTPLSDEVIAEATDLVLGKLRLERDAVTTFATLPFFSAALNSAQVESLMEDFDDELDAILLSVSGRTVLVDFDESQPLEKRSAVSSAPPETMFDVLEVVGADTVHEEGFRGQGQVVVVIDDGVDDRWPHLAGSKVVGGSYFWTESKNGAQVLHHEKGPKKGRPVLDMQPNGKFSHGTKAAIVIAAVEDEIDGEKNVSLAPDAKLIAIRVENDSGVIKDLDLLHALLEVAVEWSDSHQIACVNVSLSLKKFYAVCVEDKPCTVLKLPYADLAYKIVKLLAAKGIPVVTSVGNQEYCYGFPLLACLSNTVTSGAVHVGNFNNVDSNWDPELDLVAPSTGLRFPTWTGTPGEFEAFGGSSGSTAVASGAIALLRSVCSDLEPSDLGDELWSASSKSTARCNIKKSVIKVDEILAWLRADRPGLCAPAPQIGENPRERKNY